MKMTAAVVVTVLVIMGAHGAFAQVVPGVDIDLRYL